MTTASQTGSFWNRLSVGQKLATIPLLFIVTLAGFLIYVIITAQAQRMDSYVVFMSARQRMLVQRQVVQVLLVAQGHEAQTVSKATPTRDALMKCTQSVDYLATRKLANDSLDALLNGGAIFDLATGDTRELSAAPTEEIRSRLRDQRAALSALDLNVDKFLKLSASDPEYNATLQNLLRANYEAEVNALLATKLFAANSQAKISTMIQQYTVVKLLVAALGIFLSWRVTRGVVGPLAQVVERVQRVAQGDLRGEKLPASRDELGQLATAINQMQDSLRSLTTQTTVVTSNINAASAEILASTQQQAASTKEQAATIQQITTTMEEVRQSGAQIADRAKQVATTAEATSSITAAGLHSVQETNRTMAGVREQVEEVAEKIVSLSDKTQAVGEIIATVNDIAERSNLLALNAAIEAAGAGEQGNRFSVVANELKNLADQAKESTVQVRTILGDIQKGINSTVMLTEEAVKRSDVGKQQAEVTEQTIRRMADTTQESVQAFQQIIGATSQQQIGYEQVAQGMQDIRQAASQTAASTVQLEKAVANLNTQGHQLRDSVGRFQV